MSIRPNAVMQASTIAATSWAWAAFPANATQMPPSLSMIRLVSTTASRLMSAAEDLCSLAGEERRRRLAVAHPGPLEPAPETNHFLLEPIAHAVPPIEAIAMCAPTLSR